MAERSPSYATSVVRMRGTKLVGHVSGSRIFAGCYKAQKGIVNTIEESLLLQ